jgi:pyruvate-formate lyase
VASRRRIRFELPKLAETLVPQVAFTTLRALGWSCRLRPALREELRFEDADGSTHDLSFTLHFRITQGKQMWMRVESGRLRSGPGAPADADAWVDLDDEDLLRRFLSQGDDLLSWTSQGVRVTGQVSCVAKFLHVVGSAHRGAHPARRRAPWPSDPPDEGDLEILPRCGTTKPFGAPSGGGRLPDPALSSLTLLEFPRVQRSLRRLLAARPRICTERAVALTEAASRLARDADTPAVLLRARQIAHVLHSKTARVREDDVVLGTTTSHDLGVPVYPELSHVLLWPELLTLELRDSLPIELSREDHERLDRFVFPFWMGRNVVDVASQASGLQPLIGWLAGSRPFHLGVQDGVAAIPDLPTVLRRGLRAVADQARDAQTLASQPQAASHQATTLVIEGVIGYAQRLADQAELAARDAPDRERRQELMETALSCRRCPARPAETLLDALNAIRITVASLHQESMNDQLSLGRLDVLLQPFLDRELAGVKAGPDRDAVFRRAVERVACLLLSLADHVPLVSAAVARMRPGYRGSLAITVGGIHEDGSSAVSEMTYVLLKASEMLGLASPRIHLRNHPRWTPDYALRRACEVSLLTGGTVSIHNDDVTTRALESMGVPKARAWDWGVTGTVTPSVVGVQASYPAAVTIDLTAALEMALHDGVHPSLPGWVGPSGNVRDSWCCATDLIDALGQQFGALMDLAADGVSSVEHALRSVVPVPLLSSLLGGAGTEAAEGTVAVDGACVVVVGFADVVDSIGAIDAMVFRNRVVSLGDLIVAMTEDFLGEPTLHERVLQDTPKYGDGTDDVSMVAQRVAAMIHAAVRRRDRGEGRWVVSYGGLGGDLEFGGRALVLPSGRLAGEPLAFGLCPSRRAVALGATQLRHAAALRGLHMQGGAVLEVALPGAGLSHDVHLERIVAYARAFLDSGGMHLRVATSDAGQLDRALREPVDYRDMVVPIGGYDAYFVELPLDVRERMVREAGDEA